MLDFFKAIGSFISMIVDGISSFISIVGSGLSYITGFLSFFPAPLVSIILGALAIMVAIAIIKLV